MRINWQVEKDMQKLEEIRKANDVLRLRLKIVRAQITVLRSRPSGLVGAR